MSQKWFLLKMSQILPNHIERKQTENNQNKIKCIEIIMNQNKMNILTISLFQFTL